MNLLLNLLNLVRQNLKFILDKKYFDVGEKTLTFLTDSIDNINFPIAIFSRYGRILLSSETVLKIQNNNAVFTWKAKMKWHTKEVKKYDFDAHREEKLFFEIISSYKHQNSMWARHFNNCILSLKNKKEELQKNIKHGTIGVGFFIMPVLYSVFSIINETKEEAKMFSEIIGKIVNFPFLLIITGVLSLIYCYFIVIRAYEDKYAFLFLKRKIRDLFTRFEKGLEIKKKSENPTENQKEDLKNFIEKQNADVKIFIESQVQYTKKLTKNQKVVFQKFIEGQMEDFKKFIESQKDTLLNSNIENTILPEKNFQVDSFEIKNPYNIYLLSSHCCKERINLLNQSPYIRVAQLKNIMELKEKISSKVKIDLLLVENYESNSLLNKDKNFNYSTEELLGNDKLLNKSSTQIEILEKLLTSIQNIKKHNTKDSAYERAFAFFSDFRDMV